MWWYIAVFIVSLVLVYSYMPKAQTAPPSGLGDIRAPTAEEGREIPVLSGTRDIEGANVVDYRNLRLMPVKSKSGK